MTEQNNLEIKGTLRAHPFPELTAEIAQYGLDGSVRLENEATKAIVYFRQGKIMFAVSNQRSSRLFDILIRKGRLTRDDVVKIPNFSNDQECAGYLVQKGFMTPAERDELFVEQIRGVLIDAMSWATGEWAFTSLTRIRDGLAFEVNERKMLADYARCLTPAMTVERFRTTDEYFSKVEGVNGIPLAPNEIRVLSLFHGVPLTAATIVANVGLDEINAYHALYGLWLAGFAQRENWRSAFSDFQVASMRGAKLEMKREAVMPTIQREPSVDEDKKVETDIQPAAETEVPISFEEYLTRVESAETYYDVLGVAHNAELPAIKHAYFSLAKVFHPDHFYKEGGAVLKRVQNAFAELAAAHENLRTAEAREVYDYKIRKEIADKVKLGVKDFDEESRRRQQAGEEFERGFSLLMDDKFEAATPFLARAAHFDPHNPRYRAYYGKALSIDDKQRHKAEGEMQAAIKIDQTNPTYRIMLAEFFIQVKLFKRAEGELNRLLATFPSNREAQVLLASLK